MLLRLGAPAGAAEGDEQAKKMALHTLDEMLEGGIFDQLAGGFHRYTVDRQWIVPHFEKMLYDNGQLARAYAEAFRLSGDERYRDTLAATLDYLVAEMRDEAGGFWSSTDADSEGVEGKFFVWSEAEIDAALGEELAPLAKARYGITAGGNWEGHNILVRAAELGELAKRFDLPVDEVEQRLETARQQLLKLRGQRVAPGTDDKILAAWNGLAIAGFAAGYQVTEDERYLEAARDAASFVMASMRDPGDNGRLLRTWRRGEASLQGYLEDHAFMAEALLLLFECDFDPRWLRDAVVLLESIRAHFLDAEDGSFFFTADDHEELIARTKSITESSTPSGIASAVRAFQRAGLLLGRDDLYAVGQRALRAHHEILSRLGVAAPTMMLAADFQLGDPQEVVIAGEPDSPSTRSMLRAVRSSYPPHRVVLLVHEGNQAALEELAPSIVRGKITIDGATTAYVCRRGTCQAPVTRVADLKLDG